MRSDTATAGAAFTLESAVNLPKVEIGAGELTDGGIQAFRLFALAGLAASNAEARRLVRGGGARLNEAAVKDEGLVVPEADLRAGIKLSAGRKHHRLLQIV